MSNVVEIRPKTINKRYKNHEIKITFIPETKEWKWSIKYVSVSEFSGTSKTMIAAQKHAEKHVDSTLKLRGIG